MFTIEQIQAAQANIKSGGDFPQFVQDIIRLGVQSYVTSVYDGNTVYKGADNFSVESGAKHEPVFIADVSDGEAFKVKLKEHQQGRTSYPQFCTDCGASGIDRWEVVTSAMTCAYYNKDNQEILVEKVPEPK
uniref:Phage envelope protein n=1 Tax=Spumella elongata TaxID=89044 RepID=A0A7S3MG83_9STRA